MGKRFKCWYYTGSEVQMVEFFEERTHSDTMKETQGCSKVIKKELAQQAPIEVQCNLLYNFCWALEFAKSSKIKK